MQKEYLIKNIHCADCARVLAEAISKVDGVSDASINFVRQKFCLEIENSHEFNAVFEKVLKIIKDFNSKIVLEEILQQQAEPSQENAVNLVAVEKPKRRIDFSFVIVMLGLLLGCGTFFIPQGSVCYWVLLIMAVALIGHQTYLTAIRLLKRGIVNENLLVTISVVGAIAVQESREGLMVVGLYTIGKMLEALAVNKSRKSIQSLVEIQPEYANLIKEGAQVRVLPAEVPVGARVVVKQGEKVPLDGKIISGNATFDQKHLTGESVPVFAGSGEFIASGSIVIDGMVEIETTKPYAESTISRILTLIEDASEKKSKTETFITKFSKFYTIGVIVIAVMVGLIVGFVTNSAEIGLYRGLIILVVSCPCAFAISVPLSYFSGIGNASRKGILIKGSNYLDASAKIKTVAFDKTGTLTKGQFEVVEVETLNDNYSMIDILKFACWAEQYSTHPIAKAIMKYGEDVKLREVEDFKEIAGFGVSYKISGLEIFVGMDNTREKSSYTEVFVKVDGESIGKIKLADSIKETSFDTIKRLSKLGIKSVMLSGDNVVVANEIAKELRMDESYGELKPEDKFRWIESHKGINSNLAYVGDGINDAPSLALADVGISMGIGGSASSIEASDVVISDDNPEKVIDLIEISKHTKKIVLQNILFAAVVKITFLALSSVGLTNMIFAVFADVGVTILAILNSMRVLFYKTKKQKKFKQ